MFLYPTMAGVQRKCLTGVFFLNARNLSYHTGRRLCPTLQLMIDRQTDKKSIHRQHGLGMQPKM